MKINFRFIKFSMVENFSFGSKNNSPRNNKITFNWLENKTTKKKSSNSWKLNCVFKCEGKNGCKCCFSSIIIKKHSFFFIFCMFWAVNQIYKILKFPKVIKIMKPTAFFFFGWCCCCLLPRLFVVVVALFVW